MKGLKLLGGGAWRWVGLFALMVIVIQIVPRAWLFVPPISGVTQGASDERYACPMFCVVLTARPPDDKCPVCGMILGVVANTVAVDEHERAMIGLQASRLAAHPLERELRLAGEVGYDEDRFVSVSVRSDGWLEEVDRAVAGEEVAAGDALFRLYSPAVVTAWQDYLAAKGADGRQAQAALRNLRNLGLDEAALQTITASEQAGRLVAWHAPRDGIIVRRSAVQGAAVKAGQEVYAIAGLDEVWVQIEAFESELEDLRLGTLVKGTIAGEAFAGEVRFIDPMVDRMSRTARVRLVVRNRRRPDGTWAFVPGQRFYGRARIALGPDGEALPAGEEAQPVLAVPRSAVLDTGRRQVIYVLHTELTEPDGTTTRDYDLDPEALPASVGYEMVEVRLGALARRADRPELQEYRPVLGVVAKGDGPGLRTLEPGHVVVTEAALLLDSQAQLAGRPSSLYPETGSDAAESGR